MQLAVDVPHEEVSGQPPSWTLLGQVHGARGAWNMYSCHEIGEGVPAWLSTRKNMSVRVIRIRAPFCTDASREDACVALLSMQAD